MPCERRLRLGQSISQRKAEIKAAVDKLNAELAIGKVKPVIGPQGGITFQGWAQQADVGDGCAYRMIMASGSALARQAIARAEQLSGRTVNKQAVAQGLHSHDNGVTWHGHKG